MRILLIESDPGLAEPTTRTLVQAGHEVVRCTDADGPDFPCVGLAEDACPLDDTVDVAVAVRAEGQPGLTPREFGATCALRRRLPLVVAGGPAGDLAPFARGSVADSEGPTLLAAVTAAGHDS